MYRAISYFKDMKDNMHPYNPGDIFPREGLSVEASRIDELASANNRRGKPVIELVKEKKKAEPKEEPKVETEVETEQKPKKKGRKKNAD